MFKVYFFDEVTSTMDIIKSYPVNSVIIAKKQTRGRGKQDRVWISDESENLYMSLSVSIDDNRSNYTNFVFLTTVAMTRTLEKLVQKKLDIKIKWPNDILVNDKKVCGILMEADSQKDILVIGIGLNIDSYPESTEAILFNATSLLAEGFPIKRDTIVDKFLEMFELYINNLNTYGFGTIREEWLKYSYNLGKKIVVRANSTEITGIFEDLDPSGSLVLGGDSGKIFIDSGDVF
jgi:BirA family biotin operon repressor/biotin-[acetyl-CoA-carboxylase] ligase